MLRSSSWLNETPLLRTAVNSLIGIAISPNVIVPLQIDLAIRQRRYLFGVGKVHRPSAGSGGEPGGDGGVVGPGDGADDRRVVAEGAELRAAGEAGAGLDVEDGVEQGVGDEDVVDQFSASAVDPAVLLFGGQLGGEVEQPGGVTLVGDGLAAGADLGAGRPEQDLGGGGLGVVVEVAEHDGRGGSAGVGEERR